MTTVKQATDYLYSHIPYGRKTNLEAMHHLMHLLDHPQKACQFVHVAGTNGKGSTAAFLYHILRETSLKVGLFTSPYIHQFNERIRFDGHEISDTDIIYWVNQLKDLVDPLPEALKPGPFELVSALAFLYYRHMGAEVVVLEVGVGGTVDATNVIDPPLASVITAIGYDHMDVLGNTLEEIATKKSGIIKAFAPVVVYPQADPILQVFRDHAFANTSPLTVVNAQGIQLHERGLKGQSFSYGAFSHLHTQLLGEYQITNACVAIETAQVLMAQGLPLTFDHIRTGIANTTWPGRLEVLSQHPLFLLDGAHNAHGAQTLIESFHTLAPHQRFIFIVGMLKKKDVMTLITPFLPLAHGFITVTARADAGAFTAEALAQEICALGGEATPATSVTTAIELAHDWSRGKLPICAFGSLYYIGEVRSYFHHIGI